MKIFALVMIFASFLAGSFISVLDPRLVDWNYLVPTLAVGLAGLWIYRKAAHAQTRAGDLLAGNISTLERSLSNILANLEDLRCDSLADGVGLTPCPVNDDSVCHDSSQSVRSLEPSSSSARRANAYASCLISGNSSAEVTSNAAPSISEAHHSIDGLQPTLSHLSWHGYDMLILAK